MKRLYRKLKQYAESVSIMLALLRDYRDGRYTKIPWFIIGSAFLVILYFWNPLDVVPDFIPFIGYVDDALVVTLAYKLMKKDLDHYRAWKQKHESIEDEQSTIITP
ncbi:MAG: hypothetical protein KatS3mg031_0645 [Chitinophagales bacterium]|nr:MAG: hypothetical protein KatS3mg031_0645 [Chitinophagales bacterium]